MKFLEKTLIDDVGNGCPFSGVKFNEMRVLEGHHGVAMDGHGVEAIPAQAHVF